MTTQTAINQNPDQSTLSLLNGIFSHLSRHRRIQLGLLLLLMLASGGAELVSLGLVLPFLAFLTEPERMWQQPLVHDLAKRVGFTEPIQMVMPFTLVFIIVALLVALIRLANLWINVKLAAAVGSDLSCEAYRRTLYQSYEVHSQRNSADVITATTTQLGGTVAALNALLQLVTAAIVAAAVLMGLLLINGTVAMTTIALFGSCYWALAMKVRRELRSNGQKYSEAASKQLKALHEGLGSIRDVLLSGNQLTYLETYQRADRIQRQLAAKNNFLGSFPRYAFETLGLVAIALLALQQVLQRGSSANVFPLLGVLAFGAQRLLPALQQIYHSWATLKGYSAAMSGVIDMLNQPLPREMNFAKALHLRESIRLEGVHFRYGAQHSEVLQGLDLEIRCGDRIGLIGGTGCGKSTTVDLLMGLLAPTAGRVLVDGEDLHDPACPERLLAWRSTISHVPQNIYLADSSISENIAFGVPPDQIDMARVKIVAEKAQIASFIESSPEGYQSFVGERGIRLSGGQRQRIGIARALYKKARLLVFDEATSALDAITESAVMASIDTLQESLTVVMVAHRYSSLVHCNLVIKLKAGCVEKILTPQELLYN